MANEWIDHTHARFVNPYNFVPLDTECLRNLDYTEIKQRPGLLTGLVEITIRAKTPIFIPNTTNDNFFGLIATNDNSKTTKSYDFFSYRDNSQVSAATYPDLPCPVLPGSSIRGMIRSAFEAVTASCLSTLETERPMFKRTVKPGLPGILKRDPTSGNWTVQPCIKVGVNMRRGIRGDGNGPFKAQWMLYREGQTVYALLDADYISRGRHKIFKKVKDISDTPKTGYTAGKVHHGGPARNKHHERLFVENAGPALPVSEDDVQRLLVNLRFYADNTVNLHIDKSGYQKHHGYKNMQSGSIQDLDGACVYYRPERVAGQTCYYLAPAAIAREVFHNRLKDVVNNFAPCDDSKKLCTACAMFGMVQGKQAVSSRLRFTDGLPPEESYDPSNYFEGPGPIVLAELASPKPSATEFYLQKPRHNNPDVWNYDYCHPNDSGYRASIRGRKFYWHHRIENNHQVPSQADYTNRNVGIRPVRPQAVFKSRIYFNDITRDELTSLVWVLRPRGSRSTHYHKIGMGKPLGLGSVEIQVGPIQVRTISLDDTAKTVRYAWESYAVPHLGDDAVRTILRCGQRTLGAFLKITDFAASPPAIGYPMAQKLGEDKKTVYHWFIGNRAHSSRGAGPMRPIINQRLPEIEAAEVSLPEYKERRRG